MIEMEIFGPVTDPRREALGRITVAQSRLLGLIEPLLDFETIATGHLHITCGPVAMDVRPHVDERARRRLDVHADAPPARRRMIAS
jgi:hypothetical protein